MKIELQKLELLNFKGVRKFSAEFREKTEVRGENATGKTTLFDAFTWLLFGKDSEDRKDFNIKTLNEKNEPLHKLDHEVSAVLLVDGSELSLRRCFREKWVKKRGEELPEFTGHETTFFYNDVPLSQKEYQGKIDALLSEQLVKLITNPLYFNAMKWQDRRAVLAQLAGEPSDSEVAAGNPEFEKLLAQISGKSLAEYRREVASKRKKANEELQAIPTRIDEANRSLPEEPDYALVELAIKATEGKLSEAEKELEDSSKTHEVALSKIRAKQQELNELKMELDMEQSSRGTIKTEAVRGINYERSEVQRSAEGYKKDIERNDKDIEANNRTISSNNEQILIKEKEAEALRNKWIAENEKELEIAPDAFCCPTCKREYEPGTVDEMKATESANFNAAKEKKLAEIKAEGQQKVKWAEDIKARNLELVAANDNLRASNEKRRELLLPIAEREAELLAKIRAIEAAPEEPTAEELELKKKIEEFVLPAAPSQGNPEGKARLESLREELYSFKGKLQVKEQAGKVRERITQLEEQEKAIAQEVASLEKIDFLLAAFSRAKIEAIEQRINGKFKLVKFKMFELQINGGELECCECLVNGVPFADVNTAGKINAGLDIINALSANHNVWAPVWIDNRESINELLPCSSQVISLVVSKDKKLTINSL